MWNSQRQYRAGDSSAFPVVAFEKEAKQKFSARSIVATFPIRQARLSKELPFLEFRLA
jgi:hypothetical protein